MSLKFGIVNLLNCAKKHQESKAAFLPPGIELKTPSELESLDSEARDISDLKEPNAPNQNRTFKLHPEDQKSDPESKDLRNCSLRTSPSPKHDKQSSEFLDKSSTTTQQILANLAQFQLEAALVAASANLASPLNSHIPSSNQWANSFVPSNILNQQKTVRDKLLSLVNVTSNSGGSCGKIPSSNYPSYSAPHSYMPSLLSNGASPSSCSSFKSPTGGSSFRQHTTGHTHQAASSFLSEFSPVSGSATPNWRDHHPANPLMGGSQNFGVGPPIMKRKKPRTSFTRLQICELEKRFHQQKYLASGERAGLASKLNMTDSQVKTWFQNRRTKWRRQTSEEREAERQVATQLMIGMAATSAAAVSSGLAKSAAAAAAAGGSIDCSSLDPSSPKPPSSGGTASLFKDAAAHSRRCLSPCDQIVEDHNLQTLSSRTSTFEDDF